MSPFVCCRTQHTSSCCYVFLWVYLCVHPFNSSTWCPKAIKDTVCQNSDDSGTSTCIELIFTIVSDYDLITIKENKSPKSCVHIAFLSERQHRLSIVPNEEQVHVAAGDVTITLALPGLGDSIHCIFFFFICFFGLLALSTVQLKTWQETGWERGGVTCSRGPGRDSNPWPQQQGHSLCTWDACSTHCHQSNPSRSDVTRSNTKQIANHKGALLIIRTHVQCVFSQHSRAHSQLLPAQLNMLRGNGEKCCGSLARSMPQRN